MEDHQGGEKGIKNSSDSKSQKAKMSVDKQVAAVFGVLLLVFASFLVSYRYFKPSDSFEYSGFTVYKSRLEGTVVNFYFIPIRISGGSQPFNVMMRSDPREIENITVEVENFSYNPTSLMRIWVTTSPEYDSYAIIASQEVGRFTTSLGINTQYAFTHVDSGDYPERTCANATKPVRVIDLRIGNSTKVYSEGYCIVVEGSDYPQMIKAADKFVMDWLIKVKK